MWSRRCPECNSNNYSANRSAEWWRCWCCGTKVSIEFQRVASKEEEKEVEKAHDIIDKHVGTDENRGR